MMTKKSVSLVVGGVLTMALVSCGTSNGTASRSLSESSTSAGATLTSEATLQKRQPCGNDEGEPVAASDGSVEDRLAAAGVSDALVCELGARADGAGYGLDGRATTFAQRQDFALVMAQTCAEVASGYRSWEQVIEDDVAQGAPAASASRLYSYLRTAFCPQVSASEEPAPAERALSSGPVDENGMRGIASTLSWYQGRFEAVPLSECTSRLGAFTFGQGYALRVDADTVLCLEDYSDRGNRAEHELWSADLVFATAVAEDAALDAARQLLPEDAEEYSRVVGTNATGPNSCLSVDYHSERLEDHARDVVSRRTSDPGYVNIHLYSEGESDLGSSAPYTGTAQLASLSASRSNDIDDPVC
ncbi:MULTISPECIES: hypothetical protein [Rhodococcus]|uniref:hypothetical protein n=1 Tax=Rhodococcus TaxID=1827 RepID=UPI001E61BD00|nr:hypothetical protein [Rhodococcus pyridinivorans]MCD2119617.1 hypothetical protein [Rhodococcus pyridinivorans]MCZ4628495.1 hypothetical protein [Rhodococcus pyridinivorans]MCZ4649772.1 hypothetical protein [Rhodococcus pyridinivorans]MDJ0484626.1 hypothetical protein [Rhodococcus pyridinivorans]MDV7255806.1 hypothetical protein [Rhodococcus pyridinivorans]